MPFVLNQPQPVEAFIAELLEDLDIIDEYIEYSERLPVAFRVNFDPVVRIIDGPGSRQEPIDLSIEFDSA